MADVFPPADPTTVAPPEQPGWYADAHGAWWWWDGRSWTAAPGAAPAGVGAGPDRSQERTLALVMWVVFLVGGGWIGALIFYFVAKDKPFVRHHAAEALNLSIVFVPLSLVSAALLLPGYLRLFDFDGDGRTGGVGGLFWLGLALSLLFGLVQTGLTIAGIVQVTKGRWWRLPLPFHPVRGVVRPGEEPYSVT